VVCADFSERMLEDAWRLDSGGEVFDFFSSVSSSWWLERFPARLRSAESEKGRRYFERKGLIELTDDVVLVIARRRWAARTGATPA
jgi:hypothetical protein